MNLENIQNSLLLSLGQGKALTICLGTHNCEKPNSNNNTRSNPAWIHPPGKSTKSLRSSSTQNDVKPCLILHVLGNENGLGQRMSSVIESGNQENIASKLKELSRKNYSGSRETNKQSSKELVIDKSHESENPLDEINKLTKEEEKKPVTFSKLVEEISEGMEEIRHYFKKLDKKTNLSQQNKNQVPENNNFEGDLVQNESPIELMIKLVENSKEMKSLIDNLYEQDKVVDSQQKEYIKAVEKHYQEQLKVIEQLSETISSSASDSFVNRSNKKEKKSSKQQKITTSKSDDIIMSLEERLQQALAELDKFKTKTKTERKRKKKHKHSDHDIYESTRIHHARDSLPSVLEEPRRSIPVPKRRDGINDISSIHESRIRQSSEEVNYSNPLGNSRRADNLSNADDPSRYRQASRRRNGNSMANSQEPRGITDSNKRDSSHSRCNSYVPGPDDSRKSTKSSQGSRGSVNTSKTTSQLSKTSKKSESYFSSEDSILHEAESYDYVCKTIIKQILRRYPPLTPYAYNPTEGLTPGLTPIIRQVDQIVNDIMPTMGDARQAPKAKTDEPLHEISQDERQSSQHIMDMQDPPLIERTQNRNERSRNRTTGLERPTPQNLMDNQGNVPQNEEGQVRRHSNGVIRNGDLTNNQGNISAGERAPDRRHSSGNSMNRDSQNNRGDDSPPHDRPPNRRPSNRPSTGQANERDPVQRLQNLLSFIGTRRSARDNHRNFSQRERLSHESLELRNLINQIRESIPPQENVQNRRLSHGQVNVPSSGTEPERMASNPQVQEPQGQGSQGQRPQPGVEYNRERDELRNRSRYFGQSRSSRSFSRLDSAEVCDCVGPCTNSRHVRDSRLEESNSRRERSYPSKSNSSFTRLDLIEICNCVGSCNNPRHIRESLFDDSSNDVASISNENRERTGRERNFGAELSTIEGDSETRPKRRYSNGNSRTVSNGRRANENQSKLPPKRNGSNGKSMIENYPEIDLEEGDISQDEDSQNRRKSTIKSYPEIDLLEGDISQEEVSQNTRQVDERIDQGLQYTSTPKAVKPIEKPSFGISKILEHSRETDDPRNRSGDSFQSTSSHSFTRLDSAERCNCDGPCTNPRHVRNSWLGGSGSNVQHISNEIETEAIGQEPRSRSKVEERGQVSERIGHDDPRSRSRVEERGQVSESFGHDDPQSRSRVEERGQVRHQVPSESRISTNSSNSSKGFDYTPLTPTELKYGKSDESSKRSSVISDLTSSELLRLAELNRLSQLSETSNDTENSTEKFLSSSRKKSDQNGSSSIERHISQIQQEQDKKKSPREEPGALDQVENKSGTTSKTRPIYKNSSHSREKDKTPEHNIPKKSADHRSKYTRTSNEDKPRAKVRPFVDSLIETAKDQIKNKSNHTSDENASSSLRRHISDITREKDKNRAATEEPESKSQRDRHASHSSDEYKTTDQDMSKKSVHSQTSHSNVEHGPEYESTTKKGRPTEKESFEMPRIEKQQSSSRQISDETSDAEDKSEQQSSQRKNKEDKDENK